MCGRHPHNCVQEMVFRFTSVESECSAVEVACLAQNIRHSTASVQLHLVVRMGVGREGLAPLD